MLLGLLLVVYCLESLLAQSTSCGDLIAPDGWRYDLTSLTVKGTQYLRLEGLNSTFFFTVCGYLSDSCGACNNHAGACQWPEGICNGKFDISDQVFPLVTGRGVQLRYSNGDQGSAGLRRRTQITISCDHREGFNDIILDGTEPVYSVRIRSKAGCPAHGGYPPSFPYQYQFNKYTYSDNPSTGTFHYNEILDATLNLKRSDKILLNSGQYIKKIYNWGDFDMYHNLSCYELDSDEPAVPFQLPLSAQFLGTETAAIYDPYSKVFTDTETDHWTFLQDETCRTDIWFLSGKAIPVQTKTCTGLTTVIVDFKQGQPDGDLLSIKFKCYPFQTCGDGWDTCKYPLCCVDATSCQPCGVLHRPQLSIMK